MSGYGYKATGGSTSGEGMIAFGFPPPLVIDENWKWKTDRPEAVVSVFGSEFCAAIQGPDGIVKPANPSEVAILVTNGFGLRILAISRDGRIVFNQNIPADDAALAFMEALNMMSVSSRGPVFYPVPIKKVERDHLREFRDSGMYYEDRKGK